MSPQVEPDIPMEFYVGKIKGQWPLELFTVDAHVINWLTRKDGNNREKKVFKVTVAEFTELELVQENAYLKEKK